MVVHRHSAEKESVIGDVAQFAADGERSDVAVR